MVDNATVLVLADTHLRDGASGRLHADVYRAAERSDAILHAGDIVTLSLLDELAAFAPVHAVLGNNDVPGLAGALPHETHLVLGGVTIAMLHDSGASAGRARRMARRFPEAGVVVFGHSHIPINEIGEGGQVLFNPGSATQRRRQPARSFGMLDLADGAILERSIVELGA